jgi:hypothetical protein
MIFHYFLIYCLSLTYLIFLRAHLLSVKSPLIKISAWCMIVMKIIRCRALLLMMIFGFGGAPFATSSVVYPISPT